MKEVSVKNRSHPICTAKPSIKLLEGGSTAHNIMPAQINKLSGHLIAVWSKDYQLNNLQKKFYRNIHNQKEYPKQLKMKVRRFKIKILSNKKLF
jgi:hypothetical protein